MINVQFCLFWIFAQYKYNFDTICINLDQNVDMSINDSSKQKQETNRLLKLVVTNSYFFLFFGFSHT